ncbi:hypothetical protein [Flagellimonas marinaquae]
MEKVWKDLKGKLSEEDFQLLQAIRAHHPEPITFPNPWTTLAGVNIMNPNQ